MSGSSNGRRVNFYAMERKGPAVDLKDPNLGPELLRNAKGDLPLKVWEQYCNAHRGGHAFFYLFDLLSWSFEHSDPNSKPLPPQQAVDEAFTWAMQTVMLLKSEQTVQALAAAQRTLSELVRGLSVVQRKRGQPVFMRPIAVRAYIIRKFNPDPNKPGESTVPLRRLADTLFRVDGKCPRCHSDRLHNSNSACVNALTTSINRLKAAMKRKGIPL
jgi:hypothetical protein